MYAIESDKHNNESNLKSESILNSETLNRICNIRIKQYTLNKVREQTNNCRGIGDEKLQNKQTDRVNHITCRQQRQQIWYRYNMKTKER